MNEAAFRLACCLLYNTAIAFINSETENPDCCDNVFLLHADLSTEEIVKMFPDVEEGELIDIKHQFQLFDLNQDGLIDFFEMWVFPGAQSRPPKHSIPHAISIVLQYNEVHQNVGPFITSHILRYSDWLHNTTSTGSSILLPITILLPSEVVLCSISDHQGQGIMRIDIWTHVRWRLYFAVLI